MMKSDDDSSQVQKGRGREEVRERVKMLVKGCLNWTVVLWTGSGANISGSLISLPLTHRNSLQHAH